MTLNFDRLYVVVATLFIILGVGFFARKVKIIDDTMREWKEVELEEGTVGWLPAVAIERI